MSNVVRFEPQELLITYLKKDYNYHPSHQIINSAIGPSGTLTLHTIPKVHWSRSNKSEYSDRPSFLSPAGAASSSREGLVSWIKAQLPCEAAPEDLVASTTVPCSRLARLIEDRRHDAQVDILHISVKADVNQVILACDLDITQPRVVRLNTSLLPKDRNTRLQQALSADYILNAFGNDVIAVRRA